MVYIEYEVIVRYNGDLSKLQEELGVTVEILGYNYAIIIADTEEKISQLINYTEIEYVERPFILGTQDVQSFSSTGITKFKNRYSLTGKGVILGIIDSGIDYNIDVFKEKDNTSKILYYWDQSMPGNPPEGFSAGSLYTNEDINKAINGELNIPVSTTSSHGTHVAGICAEIANEANIIAVRVGQRQTDVFSKSTEFMRAIKFILDKGLELKMPVVINISYGSNEGSHRGISLFERYIDDMCSFWKNNIVVAAGNNADKGGHKRISIKDKDIKEVEFEIGENEKILNINIWPDFIDDFEVYLVTPSNRKTQPISLTSGEIRNSIGRTRIKGYFYPIPPYSLQRRVTIQLTSDTYINSGIWKVVFQPKKTVSGNIDIYLPTSEGISKDTKFLQPNKSLTVTVPGTADKVITVGSFNSRTGTVSIFSGEGRINSNVYKPDLIAPGEDIVSTLPGGNKGALSGTSMATPHVTGVVALFMQWGIVDKNDLFLYSQKLKSLLLKHAKRDDDTEYPNNSMGYGKLDLSDIDLESLSQINQDTIFPFRGKKKQNIIRSNEINKMRDKTDSLIGVNITYEDELQPEIDELASRYESYKYSDNFISIVVNGEAYDDILRVSNSKYIKHINSLIKMAPLTQITRGISNGVAPTQDIGVNFFYESPNLSITGKDVLIGILDSGIDYLHQDFIYPDDTSKILYIWDQSKEGKPPSGYYIGTEYTNEDINKAISENNKDLSIDEEGSGTMLAGIAAGLGRVNQEYRGIAPDSELLIVKLNKINGFYNNAALTAGIDYLIYKSIELKKPLVINISQGTNSLPGESSRLIPENIFFQRGFIGVCGIGNEGNTQTHSLGNLSFKGEIKDVEIEVSKDMDTLEIEIWISKPDKMNIGVISPSGEESKILEVSSYNIITGLFDVESTKYLINYIYPTTFSGQQFTLVRLTNVKKGIWKIRLEGNYVTTGRYNIYLPNRVFLDQGVKFRNPNPSYTVTYPGTYDDIITVGAYNTATNNIWPTSSRGPTISGLPKPDIVAPGVDVIASYPGNNYAKLTGTASASVHVTGIVAMLIQYTLVDGIYPKKAFTQKINTYLQAGAKRDDDIVYPNTTYGYGLVNAQGAFNQLK